ncbi:hypothetical protein GCM10027443_00360 [Pontibacter brevis]
MIIVPTVQASTNNNGGSTAATQQVSTSSAVSDDTAPSKAKEKVSTKPREKSILDTEVLESPMAYFKNAFSSDEDDSDAEASSDAITIALKALVATLLSTIM